MSFKKTLLEGFKQWGYEISDDKINKLVQFNDIVMEAKEHMNLTTIPDGAPSARRHFLDSLNPHVIERFKTAEKVIDVGSGAGFPGIPLAIANENVQFLLLDTRKKKCEFIMEAVDKLGLKNVNVVWGRAEVIAKQEEFREQFDFACARAVAEMPTLIEYLMPFVKVGGEALFYKAGTPENEISESKNALDLLGGQPFSINTYTIFDEINHYSIISSRKKRHTPIKFPRKSGLPSKRPL